MEIIVFEKIIVFGVGLACGAGLMGVWVLYELHKIRNN